MKKKDLMNFIDAVEIKAVRSVKEKFNLQIEIEKKCILKEQGYTERIAKIQKKVNDLFTESQALYLDMKEDITVRYDYYYNTATELQSYSGKRIIFSKDLDHCKFNGGKVELIRNDRELEIKAVKDNYSKVRVVCDSYTSANKISEYLKALGFDLSTLEGKENQALTVKIDKSKLFVCGDNK